MHAGEDFSQGHELLQDVLDRVTDQKTGGRQTNTPTYSWSCDDTLFKCGPVCLKTHGVTTVEVPDTECAGQPLDPCACDCLYDARWACADGAVICQAKDTHSMKHRKVADLVCEMRGTEKPEFDSFTMRTADECVEVPTARGTAGGLNVDMVIWSFATPAALAALIAILA